MGRAETTGGTKLGRKRKANTAKTLVETLGLKFADGGQRGNSLFTVGPERKHILWLAGLEVRRSGFPSFRGSGDRVKQDNSKPIAFVRGRHAIRISDLSTRW